MFQTYFTDLSYSHRYIHGKKIFLNSEYKINVTKVRLFFWKRIRLKS